MKVRLGPYFGKGFVAVRVMLITPGVPDGANGVVHLYTGDNTRLRLIRPLKFRLRSGGLHHTKLSCRRCTRLRMRAS